MQGITRFYEGGKLFRELSFVYEGKTGDFVSFEISPEGKPMQQSFKIVNVLGDTIYIGGTIKRVFDVIAFDEPREVPHFNY